MSWKLVRTVAAIAFAGLIVIQVVPYGRRHSNPPVVAEPSWDPDTRALAERACFDCHSNQTRWPWYSDLAPVSWFVQHHVEEGREELNFSEWTRGGATDELAEVVREGEMPPRSYTLMHPSARLSAAEQAKLAHGLDALARR